jgi:hypothetical protein
VRNATTWVAPWASAVPIGTSSANPPSASRRPPSGIGGPDSTGIPVDARSASRNVVSSTISAARSTACPVCTSVAIGWKATGLARIAAKSIGTSCV